MTSWIFLCVSALLGGMVNSIAGGGTLLTFPALLWALTGVPQGSVIANATSTVALFPGSVASAWGYRQELARVKGWLLLLLAPSFAGSVLGTILVAKRDPDEFKALVPWLILGATVLFILQPVFGKLVSRKKDSVQSLTIRGKILVVLFQFTIAVYGGYFGAGIGILMLSALSVLGIQDIHDLNALKASLASAINFISVTMFIGFELVNWRLALPMIFSAIVGGYAGARIARKLNRNWVRFIVIGIGLTVSAYYLWRSAM
ncbi:hypothetical protein VN12_14645 [Pirellula sp. SH-Sr6A]|uniref:sulfite exporter TauE/SafE family protein n=1 Tax=Pirellula sp. SH-Sr6A TaxID=1632865 RepID=UPI00078BA4CB|nr:sulfite exporter TauE/SafE family protein [Pirellula sp. SH-Sr6A]AMV33362.1 hypothetical protein VN12_14645 [Pirellula sp. SH-Sr6A]